LITPSLCSATSHFVVVGGPLQHLLIFCALLPPMIIAPGHVWDAMTQSAARETHHPLPLRMRWLRALWVLPNGALLPTPTALCFLGFVAMGAWWVARVLSTTATAAEVYVFALYLLLALPTTSALALYVHTAPRTSAATHLERKYHPTAFMSTLPSALPSARRPTGDLAMTTPSSPPHSTYSSTPCSTRLLTPFTHALIYSLFHPSTHFTHLLSPAIPYSLIHSLTHSSTHLLTHLLSHPSTPMPAHLVTALTRSLTHLLNHPQLPSPPI
jgi:hypothetical protein